MAQHDALFVRYCAKDFLDGTQALSPLEELAYRRICDLIYDTGDRLRDDDKRLAWLTKTGSQWPKIKSALMSASTGASSKLYIDQGFIRNKRCSAEIKIVLSKRKAGQAGGRATKNGPNADKSLQNLKHVSKQPTKQTSKHPIEAPIEAIHLTTEPVEEERIPPIIPPRRQRRAEPDEFQAWYAAYPHKIGRRKAEASYRSALSRASPEQLTEGLSRYRNEKPPDIAWCNPATWLNQDRWLDQPKHTNGGNGHAKSSATDSLIRGFGLAAGLGAEDSELDSRAPPPLLDRRYE